MTPFATLTESISVQATQWVHVVGTMVSTNARRTPMLSVAETTIALLTFAMMKPIMKVSGSRMMMMKLIIVATCVIHLVTRVLVASTARVAWMGTSMMIASLPVARTKTMVRLVTPLHVLLQ